MRIMRAISRRSRGENTGLFKGSGVPRAIKMNKPVQRALVSLSTTLILWGACTLAYSAEAVKAARKPVLSQPRGTAPVDVPAAAECPVPTQAPVSAKVSEVVPSAPVKPITRDRSCYLSIDDLKKRLTAREPIMLVDVRSGSEYEKFRIPGSINVSLHQIKTKTFLKNTSAVLINEGRDTVELEQACRDLRQSGFRQISILEGGLHTWHAVRGDLAGDAFAIRDMDLLKPEEIFAERRYKDWLVVDLTAGTNKTIYSWLPSQRLRLKKTRGKGLVDDFRAAVERHRKQDPGLKILVLGDTDAEYDRIMPGVHRAGLKRVFYLAGGLAGYGDFMRSQTAMWNQKDQPLRLPACRG